MERLKRKACEFSEVPVSEDITLSIAKTMRPIYPELTSDEVHGIPNMEQEPTDMEPIQFIVFKAGGVLYELIDYDCQFKDESAKEFAKSILDLN